MSHQGVLSAKQQEAAFGQILKKPFNVRCADCSSKSPTWASLDFGVFVCYNCSGAHRMLGQNVTRIRSTKLDCWTQENMDMMDALGNDLNDYWENRMPKSAKITPSATPEEIRAFVQEKYVKRLWVKQGQADPKTRYTQCLMSGVPFRVNQTNTFFSENGVQGQAVKETAKQFHSTQQWGFERKERQYSVDNKQQEVNLLSPDKGVQFDWATATNHFNTVAGVTTKQEILIKAHENLSAHQLSTGTSPLFKPKQNNLADFDLLGYSNQQPAQSKVPSLQQFNSYNPPQFQTTQQTQQVHQRPQAQQFNSYNPQPVIQPNQNIVKEQQFQQQNHPVNQQSFQQPQQTKTIDFSAFGFPPQNQAAQSTWQQSQPQPTSKPPLPGKVSQSSTNNNNTAINYNTTQFSSINTQPTLNTNNHNNSNNIANVNNIQQSNNSFHTNTTNNTLYTNTNNNTTNNNAFQTQKYQNNPFVKDMQDIMNLYTTQQPNKYEHLRNNPFM